MSLTVTGLGVGLNRIEGKKSWVFVQGTEFAGGQSVTITGTIDSVDYIWEGTIKNGHVSDDATYARVKMTCTQGTDNATFKDIEDDDLIGPGDLIDLDITVTDGSDTGTGDEGGAVVFP